jgi:hypothetical protein
LRIKLLVNNNRRLSNRLPWIIKVITEISQNFSILKIIQYWNYNYNKSEDVRESLNKIKFFTEHWLKNYNKTAE